MNNERLTNTSKHEPVAIIGFGVAGFNASVALRNEGYEGPIDAFSNVGALPYSPIMTSYFAADLVSFEECFPWTQEEVERLQLTIHAACPVVKLDTQAHIIKTSQGSFPYSKCIIATGAEPVVYGFEDNCDYSPLVLHSMADAERLHTVLSDPHCKRILISGASMVAVKMLEAALIKQKDCTLVGMNAHILDMTSFPETAARFQRNLQEQGVHFRFDQTIQDAQIIQEPEHPYEHLIKVTFSNGESETFDEILVAHGFKSDLAFIEGQDIDIDKGILVDEYMHTSNPDVFAAGDVAQALELISQTPQIVGIWKNAAIQGACAGYAIACELAGQSLNTTHAYPGSIATNTISCNGPLFLSGGISTISDDCSIEIIEDDEMTIGYLYQEDRLVGFNICADEDVEGGTAYDLSGMLTRTILESCNEQ